MATGIKKILVSQPKPLTGKSSYYDVAEKYGVEIVFRPFIQVECVSAREFRDQKVNILEHTAIVFTARTAIDKFFSLLEELRLTMPETMKYFCVSESVAVYLQKYIVYRKRKVFFGASNEIADLVTVIKKHNKEKYFIPVAEEHKEDLLDMLRAAKIQFDKAIMYRTVSNDFAEDERLDHDVLLFFSPSGVSALRKNFPNFDQGSIRIGAFGPSTCKAVEEAGLRLDISAPTPEAKSMPMALELYLSQFIKKAK
ncbi:uroporphyrinogen-III synthase [Porphyromonas crevioricanis]|uniref:Uroporphyrinogen-III synthase n=2 Tax=Porphyromonas crevioricanis TaxID=393921 RepID=A0A0A2FFL0_9PORP|nr:uroporphyrinogen-III synthase [Porphyromonas crevioricanis]KGN88862.1 uroporphyrinogen-III synthase [Porphyromonas crevioricanis]KGN95864.1 uroporphyrinogen-III synthase [Porphyromonas crevioricanis]SJZ73254.1 uroporphyrinogen-III synthase [Porphyromonas crevioricanis]SQH73499.1 uroporphyrinogen-III synthase [Porphyromonas crevioricanis]GAD06191.1 uroporphyrinogen-III synthase HemD, putative [Porphyromonas crevioricanis JCM 15906]